MLISFFTDFTGTFPKSVLSCFEFILELLELDNIPKYLSMS